MTYSFNLRTQVIFFCVLCFTLILGAKLFLVQVVRSGSYGEAADRQYATPSSNIFERGSIYFTHQDGGIIAAAAQTLGYKAAINPEKLADKEDAYTKLSPILDLD